MFIVLGFAVKLISKGFVFYRQDRIGLQMAITNADAPGDAL